MLEMPLVCSPGQHEHTSELLCAARDGHSYFLKQTPSHLAICGSGFKKKNYKQTSRALFNLPLLTASKNLFLVFLSLLLLNKCHKFSEN